MDVDVILDELLDTRLKKPPAEEVEHKLDDSFGHFKRHLLELISEAVFRSGKFEEVECSSI